MNAGPWYIALLFLDSGKEHKFIVHSQPHLKVEENWTLIQLIGPFFKQREAFGVYNEWTRNKKCERGYLLTIGLELCEKYGLKMWTEPENKVKRVPITIKMVKEGHLV